MLSELNIQAILKVIPVPCLMVLADSPNFTILDANEAFLKVIDIDKACILNKGLLKAFPGKINTGDKWDNTINSYLDNIIKTKKSYSSKVFRYDIPDRLKNKAKQRYWKIEYYPIIDDDDHVEVILLYPKDTTDVVLAKRKEKVTRKELFRSKEQYRSLFYHNPDAVFSFDLNKKFLSANESTLRLVGCSLDELLSKTFLSFISEADHERVTNHFNRAAEGEVQNYELNAFTASGDPLVLNITNLPIIVENKIIGVYGIAKDYTQYRKADNKVKASLAEKEILLTEVHHRVKNNLAIIAGLLSLQISSTEEPKARELLQESEGRVQSMSMIHEMLYQQNDFSRISFGPYINKLLKHIINNYHTSKQHIDVEIKAKDVVLDLSVAVPCALIINELLTNAYKHAFKGRECGRILIETHTDEDVCTLRVQDNGIGLPPEADKSATTLGMSLIHGLTSQIRGSVSIDSTNGTSFTITFKMPNNIKH